MLELTEWEKRALSGKMGEGLRLAMELLLGVAKLNEAKKLIRITSAHISGINYANIGDAGLEFLEDLSHKAKFSVPTTINPGGIDLDQPSLFNQPEEFVEGQIRIIESFKRMGAKISLSCIPYESENPAPKGSHVAWAESSAVVYANSVLGLKTNRESGLSALAAAITGRTPLSDLHLEKNRKPRFLVKVEVGLKGPTDFGLLGYWSAKLTDKTIGFISKIRPGKSELKHLSAAIGTAGASGMFVWGAEGEPDSIFTEVELETTKKSLSSQKDGEVVIIGCPFLTLSEIEELAGMVKGKRLRRPAYAFTSRSVYSVAKSQGLVNILEEAGIKVAKDICPTLTPIAEYMNFGTIITPSVKASHYLRAKFSVNVILKDLKEIIYELSE